MLDEDTNALGYEAMLRLTCTCGSTEEESYRRVSQAEARRWMGARNPGPPRHSEAS